MPIQLCNTQNYKQSTPHSTLSHTQSRSLFTTRYAPKISLYSTLLFTTLPCSYCKLCTSTFIHSNDKIHPHWITSNAMHKKMLHCLPSYGMQYSFLHDLCLGTNACRYGKIGTLFMSAIWKDRCSFSSFLLE
jgi:hypothetical protein